MTASEYLDWQSFEQEEPFGAWRDNYHTAMICTLICNALRGRGDRMRKLSDFMYQSPETHREATDSAAVAFFDSLVSRGG